MNLEKQFGFLLVALSCVIGCATSLYAMSAQIEMSEPVFGSDACPTEASALFALVPGSHLYDTAGSLGGTFKEKKVGDGRLYLFADIFTWIDNVNTTEFRPKKIVYTIEPGYTVKRGERRYRFFVKHQSFHDVDVFDEFTESYELYGVNFTLEGEDKKSFSFGRYLNNRVVDYDWDFAVSLTHVLGSVHDKPLYGHVWLHYVVEDSNALDRDSFTDYAAEVGIRMRGGITAFARYEFLHDIDSFCGASDHHVMLGTRYGI